MRAPKHRWQDGPSAVARLGELAEDVAERLAGMPVPPDPPLSIAALVAARDMINAAEGNDAEVNRGIAVPERIAKPILGLLERRGEDGARLSEIITHTGIPRSTLKRWLVILRDHGNIITTGNTHNARYCLPEHAPEDAINEVDDDDVA
jgi:hypothetical protein